MPRNKRPAISPVLLFLDGRRRQRLFAPGSTTPRSVNTPEHSSTVFRQKGRRARGIRVTNSFARHKDKLGQFLSLQREPELPRRDPEFLETGCGGDTSVALFEKWRPDTDGY
ncbi:uncharacterized protein LOC112460754 isoform X3 [Temnothorax curvispinosus]|uniref:Uncharacterized protein LOC112460754 isoform X3 n=1 Tax=Temnothorax curvispinosus TaxID=300111 RepID=A0A6J1QHP4_9HYME|nr:uncharacterized protein LOC112460754 isoform X3 [Temnothorax curvispinosus]